MINYKPVIAIASAAFVALTLSWSASADPQTASVDVDVEKYIGTDVGDVARSRGQFAALQSGVARSLFEGGDIKFLDTIITGADTRAEIEFVDDTYLMIGDNSRLTIDEMVFEPGIRSKGVITLTQGVFRMVSGKINKVTGGELTINSPVATIGIRGTDFWGLQEKDKLTMALIDNGILEITGADGKTVVLDTPLQAVVIERGKPTPDAPFSLTPAQLQEAAKTVTY